VTNSPKRRFQGNPSNGSLFIQCLSVSAISLAYFYRFALRHFPQAARPQQNPRLPPAD